jgi:hypothetical protein
MRDVTATRPWKIFEPESFPTDFSFLLFTKKELWLKKKAAEEVEQ